LKAFARHFCFSFFLRKTKEYFPFLFLTFAGKWTIKMNGSFVLKQKKEFFAHTPLVLHGNVFYSFFFFELKHVVFSTFPFSQNAVLTKTMVSWSEVVR
jgi:hypothetical protein